MQPTMMGAVGKVPRPALVVLRLGSVVVPRLPTDVLVLPEGAVDGFEVVCDVDGSV